MKTAAALVAAFLTLITLSSAALAQSGTTSPATPAAPAAPAAKPAEPAKPAAKATDATKTAAPKLKTVVGEVVSVDATGKTVTVKRMVNGKPEETTIGAGEKAAAILGSLKAGDHIRVAYADVEGKPMASTIAKVVKKK
jgi:Cu/Ag efflux protein CusF